MIMVVVPTPLKGCSIIHLQRHPLSHFRPKDIGQDQSVEGRVLLRDGELWRASSFQLDWSPISRVKLSPLSFLQVVL